MKTALVSLLSLGIAALAMAQSPSSAFERGNGLQAWQHPAYRAALEQCRNPPQPRVAGNAAASAVLPEPPAPALPRVTAIAGIIAADQQWRLVWAWQGNNADGPIAAADGTLLFANQDASNVMELDPHTSLARILHTDTNTGGALSRSSSGALFAAMRGLPSGVLQLEPERRIFANMIDGEPFDCVGGTINDISADAKGGVYIAVSGTGVFYADKNGRITPYGNDMNGANGIILSPDETVLYVTNGPVLVAFDVEADGALANQRDFAPLSGGGDGSAVDSEGRIYVAAGSAVNVISPAGEVLGVIPGPQGLHGVAFGGADKRTLFGIVFYGAWGTAAARNQIVAIELLTQGLAGRAK